MHTVFTNNKYLDFSAIRQPPSILFFRSMFYIKLLEKGNIFACTYQLLMQKHLFDQTLLLESSVLYRCTKCLHEITHTKAIK